MPKKYVKIPIDPKTESKIRKLLKKPSKPVEFAHGKLVAIDFRRRTALAEYTPGTRKKRSKKK